MAPRKRGARPQKAGAVSRAALGKAADPRLVSYNASIDVDRKLWREDVEGSKAHARMLGEAGIIPKADAAKLVRGLDRVAEELARDALPFSDELEDIHTHVERRLAELVGSKVAGRLHTGRSRNDQVATDLRRGRRRARRGAGGAARALQRALV